MGQGDGQLGLGLALQSTLQQLLGLFMLADLLCRTGGAQVVDQRLRVVLGGAFQVTQRARPAPFGQVQEALLGRQACAAAGVAPRPGVDHTAGHHYQP
ncbi:hypothetical protein D3C84_435340 [compost metagenome]